MKCGIKKQIIFYDNAVRIRQFAEAKGLLVKTDKIDAMILAEHGLKLQLKTYTDVSHKIEKLQQWLLARRKIIEATCLESQRLEHNHTKQIEVMIYQTLEHFKNQQKVVDEKIQTLVKQSTSFFHKHKFLIQEKGIGDLTAATLIAELPELGKGSHQQIPALVEVAPYNHDSSNLKGYRQTKGGQKTVRCGLYMAGNSAIKSNPKIRTFYQRL
ncbi:MAG: IS110 family transposase [Alphaproteobacteria bacterium]|nr:IS110 family transposase [Alphaproteobacteria bacterium]